MRGHLFVAFLPPVFWRHAMYTIGQVAEMFHLSICTLRRSKAPIYFCIYS